MALESVDLLESGDGGGWLGKGVGDWRENVRWVTNAGGYRFRMVRGIEVISAA